MLKNFNDWRQKLEESLGSQTLGLVKPNVVGGPVGSILHSEEFKKNGFKKNDADFDDDEDDDDEDSFGNDEDDDGLEGDVIGSSDADEGPDKNFPPENQEDTFGTDQFGGSDDMNGGMGHEEPGAQGEDMGFLKDLDPNLMGAGMGDEMGGEMGPGMGNPADMGDKMGADPAAGMGDDLGDEMGSDEMTPSEPCPECNPEGDQEMGAPDCPMCGGEGFVAPEGGEEDDASGMDFGDDFFGAPAAPSAAPVKQMARFEQDDFLNSLVKQATNTANVKYYSGLREDALFAPPTPAPEPQAGQAGFAPQSRVGAIGAGGYTQDDVSDIPVLGESKRRYPTISEYVAAKERAKTAKK
jgi:hypothetical protein